MSLREFFFGRPLRTEEEQVEQIGVWSGVPVLGLDALASASYGPEAALTILLSLGALAPGYIVGISVAVLAVLIAVFFSYRQTIPAYPKGGGSFTVAKENLGDHAGLLAASALSIDYVLNVAVAISAGVGAVVSAVPSLLPHTLLLCLGVLALLAFVNLRGIRSAGLLFMLPTYLFVVCIVITVTVGIFKTLSAHGHPVPLVSPHHVEGAVRAATVWIILRAFASGCTALTGVEAVSNAVPIFRQPTVILAKRTLTLIIAILACLLIGIAVVSRCYGIGATPPGSTGYESVLSQIVGAVMGRGPFYFVTMTAVLSVLALSANTSFADFPRVCRVLALDEFLPTEFAHRGSRLVYSTGIVVLTVLSGVLLIVFGGVTDRLIPLFAVGAFLAFTLSQIGMVRHWNRERGRGWRRSLVVNAIGAVATAATLIIVAVSKFKEGAWITLLVIPVLILIFVAIRGYHARVERQIAETGPLKMNGLVEPLILIPMKRLDRVTRKALRIGMSLSGEVRAVQILSEELKTEDLTHHWDRLVEQPARDACFRPPTLVVVYSAYREFFSPFLDYIHRVIGEEHSRRVAIIVPELVERRWYHFILRHRATLLKGLLIMKGGPEIVIITSPWYLREPGGPVPRNLLKEEKSSV